MQKLLTDIGKKSKKAINKSLSTKKKNEVLKDYRLLILGLEDDNLLELRSFFLYLNFY